MNEEMGATPQELSPIDNRFAIGILRYLDPLVGDERPRSRGSKGSQELHDETDLLHLDQDLILLRRVIHIDDRHRLVNPTRNEHQGEFSMPYGIYYQIGPIDMVTN